MTATSIIIHASDEKISTNVKFYRESAETREFVSLQIKVGEDDVSIFMGLDQAREFLETLKGLKIETDEVRNEE